VLRYDGGYQRGDLAYVVVEPLSIFFGLPSSI